LKSQVSCILRYMGLEAPAIDRCQLVSIHWPWFWLLIVLQTGIQFASGMGLESGFQESFWLGLNSLEIVVYSVLNIYLLKCILKYWAFNMCKDFFSGSEDIMIRRQICCCFSGTCILVLLLSESKLDWCWWGKEISLKWAHVLASQHITNFWVNTASWHCFY
jgi:hypothetical protein